MPFKANAHCFALYGANTSSQKNSFNTRLQITMHECDLDGICANHRKFIRMSTPTHKSVAHSPIFPCYCALGCEGIRTADGWDQLIRIQSGKLEMFTDGATA